MVIKRKQVRKGLLFLCCKCNRDFRQFAYEKRLCTQSIPGGKALCRKSHYTVHSRIDGPVRKKARIFDCLTPRLFQLASRFARREALAVLFGLEFCHFHSAGIIGREGIGALAGVIFFAGDKSKKS